MSKKVNTPISEINKTSNHLEKKNNNRSKLVDKYEEWIPRNDLERLAVQVQRFNTKSKSQELTSDELKSIKKYQLSETEGKLGKQGRFTMKYTSELLKNKINIAVAYYATKAGFGLDEILKVKGELRESIIARLKGLPKDEIIKTVSKKYIVKDVIDNRFGLSTKKEEINGIRLNGKLEMDGKIISNAFLINDNSKANEVPLVALPNNVYIKNSNVGINVSNPKSALDIKGNLDIDNEMKSNHVIVKKTKSKELISENNEIDQINSSSINVKNPRNSNNPSGWGTHLNWKNGSENYIRGKTEFRGDTNFVGPARLNIQNNKNNNNPTGWGTHFNYRNKSENYVRGKTEIRGEANFVGPARLNIQNNKNNNNPTGWGTHFNYRNKGENYIRGKTEIRGEVNFVDKNKDIKIEQSRNDNNTRGKPIVFNYKGRGITGISGKTEFNSSVNLTDDSKGLNIHYNRGSTHFNHKGEGINLIKGDTEINAPVFKLKTTNPLNIQSNGVVSSFGLEKSGWCHITTSAKKFGFDKPLNVDGDVYAEKICLRDGNKVFCFDSKKLMEAIAMGNWNDERRGYLPGGNNSSKANKFDNIEQCKKICGADKNCAGVTMRNSDKTCWFKTSAGVKRIYTNDDWTSVIKRDFKTEINGCSSNDCKVGSNIGNSTFVISNSTIQEIMDRSKSYEIMSTVNIKNNKNSWRNIYRYGNANNERAPALWIVPNNPWRFHFRVGTNRNTNDGFDFNIPANMKKYNTDLNIKTKISQVKQGYWHYYTAYGHRNRTGYRNVTQYRTAYRYERRYRNYTYYRNVRRYRRERRRYCKRRHIGWGRHRTRCDYYKYVNVPYTVRQPYTYRRPYNARVPYRQAYTVRRPYTYTERYPIRRRVYRTRENILIQHWVNNVYVGGRTIYDVNLRRYPGRRFYIKDPWHSRDGYEVTNVQIKKI